jgi:tetratricopeptide (TPR) repeat protein
VPERDIQLAVFFDYDNQPLDPAAILEFLKEIGRVVLKRAYGDWGSHREVRGIMADLEVELIDRPRFGLPDRQGNDILLAVDTLEMALTRPNLDTIVLVTGDSDFLPLVSRLKGYGKRIIVIGSERNTAPRLRQASDRFISYEAIAKTEELVADDAPDRALALFRRAARICQERGEPLTPQRCQQILVQLDPSFTPAALGFAEFGAFYRWGQRMLAEEAERAEEEESEDVRRWTAAIGLLYRALETLQDRGQPPTPEAVEVAMRELAPTYDVRSVGVKHFTQFLQESAHRGAIRLRQGQVELPKPVAWERSLRKALLRPHPALRPAFIQEFCRPVQVWDPSVPRTLKAVADRLHEEKRVPGLTRKPLNELIRALKFSGLLQPHEGDSYITYQIPFDYKGGLADLEKGMVKAYLKAILRAAPVPKADLPTLSTLIYGRHGEEPEVQALLDELVLEGEALWQGGAYQYGKLEGGGKPSGTPEEEP